MSFLARLGVVLGLDTAQFSKGLGDAKNQLKQFEAGFKTGMVATGLAVAAATAKVVQFADQIKDTAAAADVSMSAVLNVGHALQLAGGNAENAGKVLSNFNKVLGDAAMGDKAAHELFKELGISLRDLETLSVEELFKKTADALGKLDDNSKRVNLSMQAFGRGIRGVDVKGFNENLKEGHDLTEAQKKAFVDAAAAMDIWDNATHNLKVTMVEFLGSGGASFIRFLANGLDGIIRMVNAFADLLKKFDEWNAKNAQFDEEADAWSGRITGESPYFKPLSKPEDAEGSGTGRKIKPYRDTSGENKLAQLLKQLETLRFISIEYENHLNEQVKGLDVQLTSLSLTKNQAEVYQALYELDKKRSDEVAKLEEKRKEAVAAKADQSVIAQIDLEIAKINELAAAYSDQIAATIKRNQDFMQSIEGGFMSSFQKFQFEAINSAQWVEAAVDSVFTNMTNAINQFVETGKFSFADFVKSVIQGLIKLQMQMLITQLFAKAIGFAMGAFSTTPGISSNPAYQGPPTAGVSASMRASGGDVFSNMPYMVGERGPELFVPNRTGTIIPNHALSGMGNGQPSVVYNGPYIANMQAMDTQSAAQFLAKNKDAIYAANMSASRSVPTSVR